MSSPSKKWRVGICGCGSSIDLYKDIHCHNELFRLVATADLHIKRAQKAADQWGEVNAYDNTGDMLEQEELDLLVIAAPPADHLELALQATDKKVHLLIQKPLACTPAEGRHIIDSCKMNRCGLKVSFARRYYPAFQKAYQLINSMGQGILLRSNWCSTSGWKDRPNKQWKKLSETRGGVLVDLGSHVIDLARWWMGEAVGCRLAMSIVKGELDNTATFLLNHENGSTTQSSLSNVDFTNKESYEYIGTEGGFVLDRAGDGYPGSWNLTRYRHNAPAEKWSFGSNGGPSDPLKNPFILELIDFISALQKGEVLIDPSNLGYNTLKLTSLLYKSSTLKGDMTLDGFSINDFFKT